MKININQREICTNNHRFNKFTCFLELSINTSDEENPCNARKKILQSDGKYIFKQRSFVYISVPLSLSCFSCWKYILCIFFIYTLWLKMIFILRDFLDFPHNNCSRYFMVCMAFYFHSSFHNQPKE